MVNDFCLHYGWAVNWFRRDLSDWPLGQPGETEPNPAERVRARLSGLPGAFFLRDEERYFLGAFPVEEAEGLDPEPTRKAEWGAPAVPRWVGVLPYEEFRDQERGPGRAGDRRAEPLCARARWLRYEAVAVGDREGFRVEGENLEAVERLFQILHQPGRGVDDVNLPQPGRDLDEVHQPGSGTDTNLGGELHQPGRGQIGLRWARLAEPAALHRQRIERTLQKIAEGELYLVNLARRFDFFCQGSPMELLDAWGPLGAAPYAAALEWPDCGIVSASPELFLDWTPEGRIFTRPIKGTRPRGATPQEDLALRVELDDSPKEQAELTMVVDLERNDLGRWAEVGSVHVSQAPHVVSHPTVHHREATVSAVVRPGVTRTQLLRAVMPSGSVTGAPKVRSMDWIAEVEAERRGLYTGALGYLTHGGHLRLSMAIRVLLIKEGRAQYFVGGGIVADSDPEKEVEETLWKAKPLQALFASAKNWAEGLGAD